MLPEINDIEPLNIMARYAKITLQKLTLFLSRKFKLPRCDQTLGNRPTTKHFRSRSWGCHSPLLLPPPQSFSRGRGLSQANTRILNRHGSHMAVTCFPLSVPLPLIPFPVYAKAICVQTLVTLTRIREENEDQVFRFPSLPFACVMCRFTKPSLFHLLLSCSIFKPF